MNPENEERNNQPQEQRASATSKSGVQLMGFTAQTAQQALNILNRLFDVAKPEAVFSDPITHQEHTLITASEVTVGLGVGYGGGEGSDSSGDNQSGGGGGGGGGGGTSTARPVAAISIGPRGVHVEPIVDPTKIAIAMFTTIGAIFMTWRTMRKKSKG